MRTDVSVAPGRTRAEPPSAQLLDARTLVPCGGGGFGLPTAGGGGDNRAGGGGRGVFGGCFGGDGGGESTHVM